MRASETHSASARRIVALATASALGLAGAVVVASPAAAATFQVTTLDDSGPGSLREAITSANDEGLNPGLDTITFAAGLSGVIPLQTALEVTSAVVIDGTGAAVTISRENNAGDFDLVHAVLPAGSLPFTLIDVDIVGDAEAPQELGRGLVVEGDGGADINRVQLTDVNVSNHKAAPGQSGGGVYVRSSNYVDVLRGSISSNEVDDDQPGGGLHVDGGNFGSLHMTGTQVVSNTGGIGGGVAVDEVNGVFVTSSFFQLNTAASPTAGTGGALDAVEIAIDGVLLTDSTFDENFAELDGGAVSIVNSGRPQVLRSTFANNLADGGNGGALYMDDLFSGSTITDSTFTANSSDGYGGAVGYAVIDDGDSHTVSGSTFSANVAGDYGVSLAIAATAGSFLLQNSTLDELAATGDPFAFIALVVSPTAVLGIENSTITGPGAVGMLVLEGTATVENTILDGRGVEPLAVGGVVAPGSVTYSHSLLVGAPGGPGIVDGGGNVTAASTGLLALAANGGLTNTRLPEAGSPAIDAGDPAFAAPPATDQRGTGFARVLGGRIDIGAVEAIPTLPATGGTVSWWMIALAGGVVLLGIGTLAISRRGRARS